MRKLTDEQIKELSEKAGFWGVDVWWKEKIPMFREFLKLAQEKEYVTGRNNP